MKLFIEQIALHPRDPAKARRLLEKLGMTNWIEDTVKAEGTLRGEQGANVANLSFNYQAAWDGDGLEIIHYTAGQHWCANDFSVSHLGMYCSVADLERWAAFFAAEGIAIAQDVRTTSHTDPAIAGKRWYRYTIFATRAILGVDLKFITRLDRAPGDLR